jgi:uncharacterized membrane protein
MTCPASAPDTPKSTTIHHSFGNGGVIADTDTGTIEFRYCFVPRGFLTNKQPSFVCTLDDVTHVYDVPGRRGYGTTVICTTTGKAVVPMQGKGYRRLREWFVVVLPQEHPSVAKYIAFSIPGILIGLALSLAYAMTTGWWSTLGLLVILTVLGISSAIYFARRWYRIRADIVEQYKREYGGLP